MGEIKFIPVVVLQEVVRMKSLEKDFVSFKGTPCVSPSQFWCYDVLACLLEGIEINLGIYFNKKKRRGR